MVVYTPRLCNDVAFLPPREEKAENIVCREVVHEEDVSDWEQRKRVEAEMKLVGETAATVEGSGRPVVGGIEVGGMKLVGREGKRLDPPQNIQPGSHGHGLHGGGNGNANNNKMNVMELISQEPREKGGRIKKLSDKDLKKLGLDPSVVDAARRELEEVAQGKGWRLEVFEIDGARELRGVVDGAEDEDEDEDGEEGEGEYGSQEEYKDEL